MFGMLKQAGQLKKEAFYHLDNGKKKIQVDVNLLIDIILAYESVSVGDIENLNYSLDVAHQMIAKYQSLMDKIADLSDPASEIWELSTTYV